MKKFLNVFITICIIAGMVTFLSITASAEIETWDISATSSDNVTATLDTETGTMTISGTGAMKDYESDSSQPWSYYRKNIKKVVIEPNITKIGKNSFYYCINLSNLIISNSVTSIEEYAFGQCNALKKIRIPDSVTSIGTQAFRISSNADYLIVGKGVTNIGMQAFHQEAISGSLTYNQAPKSICFLGDVPSTVDKSIPNFSNITIYYSSEYDYFRMSAKTPRPKYLKHDEYGENWSIITQPTQTKSGVAEGTCSITGAHQVTRTLPPLSNGDFWTPTITIEETCCDEGIITYSSECGDVTEGIPTSPDKHIWNDWTVIVNPSNLMLGVAKRTCSLNKKHTELQYLSVLTDSEFWTKGEYIAPTTTSEGSQEYISEYGTFTETIPKLTPTPTIEPTATPTVSPSPSATPSTEPSIEPSTTPTTTPTISPSIEPSATPTTSPDTEPTDTPSTTVSPGTKPTIPPDIDIDKSCIKITATYSTDGILESVSVEEIKISEIILSQNTQTNKVFYWESLERMKPLEWLYNLN